MFKIGGDSKSDPLEICTSWEGQFLNGSNIQKPDILIWFCYVKNKQYPSITRLENPT